MSGYSFAEGSPAFRRLTLAAFLIFFFLFRFIYGLYCPAVTANDDYVQTYTIGLKAYTTHTWPYFGPNVQGPETAFHTQIPGAMEGVLIALSLELWPTTLSPYLFVNLLTFLALTLFAWYCCKRLPGYSPWFIFTWIYLAPWDTHYSTQVISLSYACLGSVLFFLGFFETVPSLRLGVIGLKLANVMMGFGFFWVMQLHMSWVAFTPFLFFSLFLQLREGGWKTALPFGFLGSLAPLSLLVPTFFTYGFRTGGDVHGFASGLNWINVLDIVGTLARFLSLASFEMPRFVGSGTHERFGYFLESSWLFLPGLFLWGAGLLQPFAMIYLWVKSQSARADWKAVKFLGAGAFLVIYGSFFFTPNMAASFRIWLLFPTIMLYSLYCWDSLRSKPIWRILGWVFILSTVYFQAGYTLKNVERNDSVYAVNREKMEKAIQEKNYHLLAERLPGSLY